MMTIKDARMARAIEAYWAFHCPECGFGHSELGRLGRDHDIYCIVCEHEHGRLVRLDRWLIEDADAAHARLRTGRDD